MSVKDFSNFLCGLFDTEVVEAFYMNKISGKAFLKMTETHLNTILSYTESSKALGWVKVM